MPPRTMTAVSREDCELLHRELLRLGALGARRAVPRRLVAAGAFDGNDRRMRHIMAAAPAFGFAVGSSEDGYFVAEGPADLDCAIADLQSRVGELARRAAALETIRRAMTTVGGRLF